MDSIPPPPPGRPPHDAERVEGFGSPHAELLSALANSPRIQIRPTSLDAGHESPTGTNITSAVDRPSSNKDIWKNNRNMSDQDQLHRSALSALFPTPRKAGPPSDQPPHTAEKQELDSHHSELLRAVANSPRIRIRPPTHDLPEGPSVSIESVERKSVKMSNRDQHHQNVLAALSPSTRGIQRQPDSSKGEIMEIPNMKPKKENEHHELVLAALSKRNVPASSIDREKSRPPNSTSSTALQNSQKHLTIEENISLRLPEETSAAAYESARTEEEERLSSARELLRSLTGVGDISELSQRRVTLNNMHEAYSLQADSEAPPVMEQKESSPVLSKQESRRSIVNDIQSIDPTVQGVQSPRKVSEAHKMLVEAKAETSPTKIQETRRSTREDIHEAYSVMNFGSSRRTSELSAEKSEEDYDAKHIPTDSERLDTARTLLRSLTGIGDSTGVDSASPRRISEEYNRLVVAPDKDTTTPSKEQAHLPSPRANDKQNIARMSSQKKGHRLSFSESFDGGSNASTDNTTRTDGTQKQATQINRSAQERRGSKQATAKPAPKLRKGSSLAGADKFLVKKANPARLSRRSTVQENLTKESNEKAIEIRKDKEENLRLQSSLSVAKEINERLLKESNNQREELAHSQKCLLETQQAWKDEREILQRRIAELEADKVYLESRFRDYDECTAELADIKRTLKTAVELIVNVVGEKRIEHVLKYSDSGVDVYNSIAASGRLLQHASKTMHQKDDISQQKKRTRPFVASPSTTPRPVVEPEPQKSDLEMMYARLENRYNLGYNED